MNIVIHCMGMPFGPDTVRTASLGGSESAAYYLARELARRGHQVSLWTTRDAPQEEADGVKYLFIGPASAENPLGAHFEYYARHTPHDVLVIQRHPAAFHKPFAAKVCIWQLHDLALKRAQPMALGGTWQVDAITGVSQWHVDQIKETWGLTNHLHVVPNGVDPSLYVNTDMSLLESTNNAPIGRLNEEGLINLPSGKFILLYQSRPERGFEHLVRPGGIMDRIQHLAVHLVACGYDNTVAHMAGFYDRLAEQAARLPNVSMVGALTKPQLAALQRKADLLIYPTEFNEVSCITAMEAMHAALPMLTSAQGALPETCAGSGTVLLPLKDGVADEDAFVAWLEANLPDEAGVYPAGLKALRELQKKAAASKTWAAAATTLEQLVVDVMAEKRHNEGAIMRTAIERSDIGFAKWFKGHVEDQGGSNDLIYMAACEEIDRLYGFIESPERYAAHYAKHQGEYYDGHEDLVIGEDVTSSTRFRGAMAYLMQHVKETNNEYPRVLDYGCAHGHYLVPFAKALPGGHFSGIDISMRAVSACQKWLERDGVTNAVVAQGDQALLEQLREDGRTFDVIFAGEVLEHVWNPIELLEKFGALLSSKGCIIVTTPYGRWEHTGTEAFRTGREHLHHFDKEDIQEMTHAQDLEIVCAPASFDRSGVALGSWVWKVRLKNDKGFFWPNYERKLMTYAPRETISACLIVKDAEKTLRKCIESLVDWVDEVVVAVDPSTTDRTVSVLHDLWADFPNRPFRIVHLAAPVLEMGFDAARNASIVDACGDWVLWCDADEELHNPSNLHKLARRSLHDGYGFAQVHYSIDPPNVLTTDYPCRMFRRNKDIKFFGLVHEHPETEMGKGIPSAIVRPEVSFLHNGYVDENTRRLRYQRNLPLLKKDIATYPNRKLNAFLWLRDLAQGMMFEQQQMGGGYTQEHLDLAREGVKIFETMIDGAAPRMINDALPYYSHCVNITGEGFDAKFELTVDCPQAPGLGVKLGIAGRFHTREFYKRVVAHLIEESTKTYEDKYL